MTLVDSYKNFELELTLIIGQMADTLEQNNRQIVRIGNNDGNGHNGYGDTKLQIGF